MLLASLDIQEISALLMVLFTCIITVANILLWLATRRTIALQVNSNYSINHQSIINNHRDLFLGLLQQHDILKKFADANGLDIDQWEIQIISSFFINHAFVHYLNFTNGTIDESYLEGFKQDAGEVLALPTVQSQWTKAKSGYSPAFRRFVESELMSPTDNSGSKSRSAAGLGEPSPLR